MYMRTRAFTLGFTITINQTVLEFTDGQMAIIIKVSGKMEFAVE